MTCPEKRLRVLLLDDDAEQAHLLGRFLSMIDSFDVELLHFSRAERAMALLLSGEADLVILDHQLAGKQTGLDILQSLRDMGHDGPVIMMTGRNDQELVDSYLRIGADAYLHKADLDPGHLSQAIQVALTLPHKLLPRVFDHRTYNRPRRR